ncbi:nitric oxide synthase, brain-like isoform X2 [Patiria miniata]|uniref:Nitric oxide synthase n=1 Tax=Patiria miniata TaxID=46514 RepID=A0A913ZHS4_PATMI|nr:nitric oxide synthase, brain-like isoform X2 [Patiria miniata]
MFWSILHDRFTSRAVTFPLFDARGITTAQEMFNILCSHLTYATNDGNIRSAITVFPQRTDGQHDFRVWNILLIKYAGYQQPDGSVIGDPASVEFTKICERLGWKGEGGRFDVLPLVLQANGEDPEWFELPKECILQVKLTHPEYDWFAELGLQWYAVPAVSSLLLDIGGIEFPACPFNGWYMSTEIGCRNLCDVYRYNLLQTIANKMSLQTTSNLTLWKDRTLLEVNVAVLHSFQKARVTITDHHSASESFMVHMEKEQKLRGGCPADWVWVVPPMSSSLCPVFHQEMLYYSVKPSFDYQANPWLAKRNGAAKSAMRKGVTFKGAAVAVKYFAHKMKEALKQRFKATILYATETGRSKQYAERINRMFSCTFDSRVLCMEDYDVVELETETLILIITSTFGNGEPPENGEGFARHIAKLVRENQGDCPKVENGGGAQAPRLDCEKYCGGQRRPSVAEHQLNNPLIESMNDQPLPLSNLRYSVFGLGSTAYPHFCAFAHALDAQLGMLGGERLLEIAEGDELVGQEVEFLNWAENIYQEACDTFCIKRQDASDMVMGTVPTAPDSSWADEKFRIVPEAEGVRATDPHMALYRLHGKQTFPCKLLSCKNLQAPSSGRATNLVKLDTSEEEKLLYEAGDHAAVFPQNREELVEGVLERVDCALSPNDLIKIECREEKDDNNKDLNNKWVKYQHLPVCSLRQALKCFLEIAKPPPSQLLKIMAAYAIEPTEAEALVKLGRGGNKYDNWIYSQYPTLVDVFDRFPSLRVPAALLLTQLPLLKPRYYSISSSPSISPGEIHLTIAVVCYQTQNNDATRYGVCSNWLGSIAESNIVPVFIRKATKFHMPEDKVAPMILIGPGAGIAPFRSFWQQRRFDMLRLAQRKGTSQDLERLGDMTLVFGCRQSSIDNIYMSEMQEAKAEGLLTNVWTAYSRDPDKPKAYVQDLLFQNAHQVFELLSRLRGHIYVCGDVTMAADVSKVIQSIGVDVAKMSDEEAKYWVTGLRDENRYHEDIFGVTLRTAEVTEQKRRESYDIRKHRQSPTQTQSRERSSDNNNAV